MSGKPQIGDTVVIRGVVTKIHNSSIKIKTKTFHDTLEPEFSPYISMSRISEVIPKPWVPKVGDEVDVEGKWSFTDCGYTVLALHGDGGPFRDGEVRRWAVIAYKGDGPETVFASELRERKIESNVD